MSAAFAPGGFAWLTGIEDTCVYPPERYGMPPLDEFALTGHDALWRDDLRWVRDLGCDGLRYGAMWPRVHTAPGRFDWRELDERIGLAHELGLTVVADLVHYGAPTWLEGAFADPAYPDAAAEFAGAFAERYRGVVEAITPFNEPVTTASFSGLRGVWPPALQGWEGWTRVTMGIARGMARSIQAIRAADPDAVIVHVEASALYRAAEPDLEAERAVLERVAVIPTDLLLGRVDPDDESGRWLRAHGADPAALAELRSLPATVDVLGVNYYPDLTPRVLETGPTGVAQRAVDAGAEGLERVLRAAEERWGLPMVVTETSIEGDAATRSAWLRSSVDAIERLRGDGMDLRGYTWWPLVDFVDWSWAAGGRNVEEFHVPAEVVAEREASGSVEPYLRRMGLARLEERDGVLHRVPDASAATFTELARSSRSVRGGAR